MDVHSHSAGLEGFIADRFEAHEACMRCPSPRAVAEWFEELLGLLLPERSARRYGTLEELRAHLLELRARLAKLVAAADPGASAAADRVAEDFLALLPELHAHIVEDVTAIERGDPAATSRSEVARTYPGVFAIAAYRVAHALHRLDVPLLPRILSAHAHGATGIDIHPAARIGRSFCIDHGTGVVIGATSGDRRPREALPGRDARRAQRPQGGRGRQAASDDRGRRRDLRRRDHPRRRHRDRPR
jgi:serine O-acetyltransferase